MERNTSFRRLTPSIVDRTLTTSSHKTDERTQPTYIALCCLVVGRHDLQPYFTRRSNQYRTFSAYSNSRRFSIKFVGIGVWNDIPSSLQQARNLQSFKKLLRVKLLNDGILK